MTEDHLMKELPLLWSITLGDPRICVAILDGPVDHSHPCFNGSKLAWIPDSGCDATYHGPSTRHGTHVASVIFGKHDSPVCGIVPNCKGIIVPVFSDRKQGGNVPCSQIDLARAITQSVEWGANVINISGGQFVESAETDQLLANAVNLCKENNVLIIAAAGNEGCNCVHVPAALDSVLAVGAMDRDGFPLISSNWGKAYQTHGVLALGEKILGASPGGGTTLNTGTSFAAAVVSGVVALMLSIQYQKGERPDPHAIRAAILKTAMPCKQLHNVDDRRFLAGRLDILGLYTEIMDEELAGISHIHDRTDEQQSTSVNTVEQSPKPVSIPLGLEDPSPWPAKVAMTSVRSMINESSSVPMPTEEISDPINPSINHSPPVVLSEAEGDCGCGGALPMQLVYALGELGYDFGSQAQQDAFTQSIPEGTSIHDYLDENPWGAQSLIWTLSLDATPIYAIAPAGPFASATYDRLRSFIRDEDIERISVPGYIAGSTTLYSGQKLPLVIPELRGMYSWSVAALIDDLKRAFPVGAEDTDYTGKIREYLERIYYEFRNLGITPKERALNFSATNAFQITEVMKASSSEEIGLGSITVEKSPICRPDSDCYDVKLNFVNLLDSRKAGKVFRFTIDVSNVIPVTIGKVRTWSVTS